jgi:hypothetical protein
MADLKISQLNSLAGTSLADTDVLAVVDTSASETKKITSVELVRYGYGLISAGTLDGDIIEAATTSARGTVQLTNSTSSTSTTTAAVPNAVKSAYDLADAALPKAGGTMTGQILADDSSSASTPGYAFDGDGDTGMVRTGANELALVTGGSNRLTIDASGNVTVPGNLTVSGTTTTIDTTNLVVEDKNIEIGAVGTPTDVTADGGGITLKGSTDKTINWVDATDAWTFSEHVNIASTKEYRIAGTKVLDATSLGSGVVSSSLTSVGTIGTGTWNATTIAVNRGGTGQTSYTDGQLLIGNSTGNTLAKATLTAGSGVSITNGSGSITISATGSGGTVTSVTASSPLASSGGTTPDISIQDGTTAQKGAVQLEDSTSSTSTTKAATPNSVKSAYDLANAALSSTGGTITGNLEIGSTGSLTFEGSSADANETTLTVTNPTADRTITLPDATGTVVLSGAIVNADINASAAIADTKLDTISTAGKVSNSATTATSSNTANAIVARDASGNFSAGVISDTAGNVRTLPQNSQTSAYTLVATDTGKHISITTGGVTIPSGVFSTGDVVSIFNNSGSNQTITQGASTTVRQAGTANTGNRTLAQYGVATVLCVASNTFVISGAGLS